MPTTLFLDANLARGRQAMYEMVQYVAGRATPAGVDVNIQIGTLPVGAVLIGVDSKVITAITGTTPTLNVGTASGGTQIAAGLTLTAGSATVQPAAALVMPLAAATAVWVGTTGSATGDAIVVVRFIIPVA